MYELFQKIKAIKPDSGFLHKSRQEILITPKAKPDHTFYLNHFKTSLHESLNFAAALTLTSLLIYVAFTGVIGYSPKLAKEDPSFNIELRDAKYYREIAPDVYVVVLNQADDDIKNKVDAIIEEN